MHECNFIFFYNNSENNLSEYGNDDDENGNGLFGIDPMINYYMSNSHLFENLFAIERDKQIINNTITIISNNNIQILNNIHGLDGYIVANLIIEWYKQLPMPIINNNTINTKEIKLIKNIQMAGEYIENKMNKQYQTYFKWLLDLMINIIINEKINKMSIKNICDVMDKNLCQNENISTFFQLCVLWRRFNCGIQSMDFENEMSILQNEYAKSIENNTFVTFYY